LTGREAMGVRADTSEARGNGQAGLARKERAGVLTP